MKNFKKLALYVLPIALLLSSCKEDDETPQPTTPTKPGIEAVVLEEVKVKTILEDRIADPNLPDYLVNKELWVAAELTVKPGVVIAFAENAGLHIKEGGLIIAKGEAAKKVVFTGQAARTGFWQGIIVFTGSQYNEFSHTEIKYAGSKIALFDVKAALSIYPEAKVTIKNTTISQSGGYGLYLPENSLLNTFATNTFKDNAAAPVLTAANTIPSLDAATAYTGNNGRNVVEVVASTIAGPEEVTWPAFNDNTPYRFLGRVSAYTGWVLTPGITIEIAADQYFDVTEGYLKAVGTADKKITFTGVVKTPGSWNGVMILTRSTLNIMNHVQLEYAGANPLLGNTKASLALMGTADYANLNIKNSSIRYSGGYGIHLYGREASLNADASTSNTFTANTQGNIYRED